jgi:hypothetical protein
MTNILEVRELVKHYNQVRAMNGISFTKMQAILRRLPGSLLLSAIVLLIKTMATLTRAVALH